VILGFFIRSEGIFSNNVLFLYDSARDLLYVKNIILNHHFYLIGPSSGGLQGYFQGVLWFYILIIPFMLGHGNPLAGTIFMIICSLTSVVLTFYLIKKISNNYAAILATTFYAVISFSVATSRYLWNPYPIVWLMPLYFYFIYQYFSGKKTLIWVALLTGLFIHFEAVYGVPLIMPLIILTIMEIKKRDFKQVTIGFVLFMLPMIPSVIFDLRHHFLIAKSLLDTIITSGGNITHKTGASATPVTTRIVLRGNDLFNYTVNAMTQNLWINIVIFACALYALKYKYVKRSFLFFSLIFLLTPFFFLITLKYAVWSYYWIGETPYFVLLVSVLIGSIPKKVFSIMAILLVFLFSGYWQDLNYHKDGFSSNSATTLATEIKTSDIVFKDSAGKPFSVYVLTPPVYDYVYEYIFWWRGNTIYQRFPTNTPKQKLTYVIIEQNNSDPTGNFFIKHRLHIAGKSIKTWKLPEIQIKKFITTPKELPVDPNIFPQF
jgi:hypothetical protein